MLMALKMKTHLKYRMMLIMIEAMDPANWRFIGNGRLSPWYSTHKM